MDTTEQYKIVPLTVSEHFLSVQGEGKTVGTLAVFIRLAGCNLLCEGAGWRCDTIEVWRKGTKWTVGTFIDEMEKIGYLKSLADGAHLIITGGEPMLHIKSVEALILGLGRRMGKQIFIEVETNGTIEPSPDLIAMVDQWNVSPKLENSGEKESKRYHPSVLVDYLSTGKAIFKYVVGSQTDVNEAMKQVGYCGIPINLVYLMPAGETRNAQQVKSNMIVGFCKEVGCNFSPRLHLFIWDKATGV